MRGLSPSQNLPIPRGAEVRRPLAAEARWVGRSVNGVPVFGPPAYLETLIEEFAVHGVSINRVIIADTSGTLSVETLSMLREITDPYA